MSHRMGDRELLELVAKAAGYEISGWHKNGYAITEEGGWNPLTDDGDALRLAHKLGLLSDVLVWPRTLDETRRAIVMAAAEVGRRKQSEVK